MMAGQSPGSSPKESPPGEEEEDCTADEEEPGNVAVPVQHPLGGPPENPPHSGLLNPWRHSDLRMQSPPRGMTITPLTDDPPNLMQRNSGRGLLRVVEKGLVERDQHGPPGKTNPLALDA